MIILCGGFGTRLSSVSKNRPKVLVEVVSSPFLDHLINYISSFGFKRFVLCAGHKSEQIEKYYAEKKDSLEYVISIEQDPLGTAGAIKNAEPLIQSDMFLGFNGDSFCPVDLKAFLEFHIASQSIASIVVTSKKDPMGYGSIRLNKNNKIENFSEKNPAENTNLVSAGIYVFGKEVLQDIPPGQNSSLEHEIFPGLMAKGLSGFQIQKPLFDIGTPERLEFAKANLYKFIQ